MSTHVVVWDLETVPDIKGFTAVNGHDGKSDDEIRAEMGDKCPKHIYHSIICIGALIAHRDNEQSVNGRGLHRAKPARCVSAGGWCSWRGYRNLANSKACRVPLLPYVPLNPNRYF